MANVDERQVTIGGALLKVRALTEADRDAVLSLHRLVFGEGADAHWFAWKYVAGGGRGTGAWHNGELVAFTGGLPRAVWHKSRALRGMQMADVMVHPDWRGVLTRRGPFFQVTHFLHSTQLGEVQEAAFQVGFGFPNARHAQLGVALKLMLDQGAIEAMNWNTASQPLPWHWRWRELAADGPDFDQAVMRAWKAMQGSGEGMTLGLRDAATLRWRYVERPDADGATGQRYRFFELRRAWSLQTRGIAVLDLLGAAAQWLDWVGPLEWMPMAARACRLQAGACGAHGLTAWASPLVARHLGETEIAGRSEVARLAVSAFSASALREPEELRWWLMGGDTDFL